MNRAQKYALLRILAAAGMLVGLHFVPVTGWLRFVLYLVPYLLIGHELLIKAAVGLWNRQFLDENFLMAVATVGALVLGLTHTGDYTEAVAVMLFFQLGELFESCAVGKSRKSISALMDIRPDYANIEEQGALRRVDPEEVSIGSIIVVQPGEKVPLDGTVISGHSTLDTSALTGESLPLEAAEGSQILSGCINLTGLLKIRTTKAFEDSTVSKILDLVENAGSRKSRSENFIAKFAHYYTPAVCFSALALGLLPPLLGYVFGWTPQWNVWMYRALSFLVASCPCALVISIPLTFFAGIGGASQAGILVKGSNYLETLSKADTVVFDKTGTLTRGEFSVTAIHSLRLPEQQLLELAALAEIFSSHPISKGLRNACGVPLDSSRVSDVQEQSGHGVAALVDGTTLAVGNEKWMTMQGLSPMACPESGTAVHIAVAGNYAGCIMLDDTLKPTAKEALAAIKKAGIRNSVLLTGDRASAAEKVAAELGIPTVYSQLLPSDKVTCVESLLAHQRKGAALVFVGDGINDAPVLSRADVGIAMGAMGSDAAIEAADIVLMDDDPAKIAKAVRISGKCMRIVYQNIVFAIGIKVLALILVALGAANMWMAIFADVGVLVLAICNAIRAMFVKHL